MPMRTVTEPEFTKLAERVATAIKHQQLSRQPGMDETAIALNCYPTTDEVIDVKKMMRLIQQAGYEIVRDTE